MKIRAHENRIAEIGKVDFDVGAAAAVIVVPLEKAVCIAVVRVHVSAINLKAHLGGRCPRQCAHASVT
jgi:hypothetical protein